MSLPRPSLASLRVEYGRAWLAEGDLHSDPLLQYEQWLHEAVHAPVEDANAVTLATVSSDGQPHARTVLVKAIEARGVQFFTNQNSHKGQELAAHPQAALLSFWPALQRQVRLEGWVEPLTSAENDAYFAERPRLSQIGAWASPQSQPIADRQWLEQQFSLLLAQFGEDPVPRPTHWGGYVLKPQRIEFWQGRPSRLHDRLVFQRVGDQWQVQRLAP